MRRPLLVGASLRGFTVVTEGSRDEPAVHTRSVEHAHASHGQYLKWYSRPLFRHCSGLGRHRRMALKKSNCFPDNRARERRQTGLRLGRSSEQYSLVCRQRPAAAVSGNILFLGGSAQFCLPLCARMLPCERGLLTSCRLRRSFGFSLIFPSSLPGPARRPSAKPLLISLPG